MISYISTYLANIISNLLQTFRQYQIYQNLICVSGYLDFYYQFVNKELEVDLENASPTTAHPYAYLPLNNFFKANEHRSFGPIFIFMLASL